MEFADLLAMATAPTRTVRICVRGDLGEQIDGLRAEWRAVVADQDGIAPSDRARDLWDQLAELEAEADDATVEFTVRALSSKQWRRLVAEHPPPADNPEGWRWDLDTFVPAALAACIVEPWTLTVDQADELVDRMSNGQFEKLFGTVLAVNSGDDLIPKSVTGTGRTRGSGPSATTPAPEGSRTPSS
jgi:hypothetical protein